MKCIPPELLLLSRTAQIRAQQQALLQQQLALKQLAHDRAVKARKPKGFRPVFPNKGLEVAYRQRLDKLIQQMHGSVLYWLTAAFKANEPEVTELISQDSMSSLASGILQESPEVTASRAGELPDPTTALDALTFDALPAIELRRALRRLSRRWLRNFNQASLDLARWFSMRVHQRSMLDLHNILRRGGWTVEHQTTQAQRDILQATIQANVSLIRSIPSRYFTQIEGMVMRSVQSGRDLQQLTNDLQREFHVTRKRAVLIARDQNNKATAAMVRARQIELGITQAIWVHSGAGKHPRPTHVANNGKKFDVRKGWWDPAVGRYIFPGTEINCRCVSRSVIQGFTT